MAKVTTYEEVIQAIAGNYEEIERSIANQLMLNVPNHYPTEGSYRETVWKSLLEMIVPRKYCIEKGVFIIDSCGHKSKEVDLAIFDELYTPYIFNYGTIKFIPIEAVAAVVQCKSVKLKKDEIEEWVETIDNLISSMDSVARMAGYMADNASEASGASGAPAKFGVTQTATRPVKLLCTLAGEKDMSEYKDKFDILLGVDKEKKKLIKSIPEEARSLENWNGSLNHAIERIEDSQDKERRVSKRGKRIIGRENILLDMKVPQTDETGEENVILSLIFQLNQLLMIINNPMLFPHRAYAKQISSILKKSIPNEGDKKDD